MAKRIPPRFLLDMVDGLHGAALATLLGADLFSAAPRANEPAIYDLKPKAPALSRHTPRASSTSS